MPIVQLALEAPIGAGPGPNQTDVNADCQHSRDQRRAVTFAVRLNAPLDIVGVTDVVLGAWMPAGPVRLLEVQQVAALERRS